MGSESISTVLWDLDDTICWQPTTTDELLADAFEDAGVEPFFTGTDFEEWIPRVTATDQLDLREKCFSAIADEKGVDRERGLAVAHAYENPDPRDVQFVPGAEETLKSLGEDHRFGLVTNGPRERQQTKLAALGIEDLFETKIFATPEQALKPDPEPFHRALDALAVDPGRAVHVGNSLESDVAGARAAGITSLWVAVDGAADPDPRPDYAVTSLQQLVPPPWK